jgi:lysophospholipase L1-like esterase
VAAPAASSAPAAAAAATDAAPRLPQILIAGDSTSNNGANLGWGSHLASFFDPTKVSVVNLGRAGLSARTYTTGGNWARVASQIHPGDVVLIQFGHNDINIPGGPAKDTVKNRSSVEGIGEETVDVTSANGRTETVYTFGHYLRQFIADTKAKGGIPVLFSLTVRDEWTDGKVERGFGNYGLWTAQQAKASNVAFVDLTNIIADQYDKMGKAAVDPWYPKDTTHSSPEGAEFNALNIVAGLKTLKDDPVAAWFSDKGKAVPPATMSMTFADPKAMEKPRPSLLPTPGTASTSAPAAPAPQTPAQTTK